MNSRLTGRQLIIYGLIVLGLGAVIGSVSLTYPFGRDQAFYAYIGQLLLDGKMNYLYAFDLKPPGSQFLFAFAQIFSGDSMFNHRIFDIVWQSITAFIIFIIAFKVTARKNLALVSAFLYLFLYYRLDFWHTYQADGSLNLFIAAAVLLMISSYERHSFLKVFFAGVMVFAALICKYTIISFVPIILFCILISKKELFSLRIKNILIFTLGILIPGVLTAILFIVTGAFDELLNIQFVQTPLYTSIAYETESGGYITKQLIKLFTYSVYTPFVGCSIFFLFFLIFKRKLDFTGSIILGWVISSLFSLIIQWKFYEYHFLVIIPPIILGTVIFANYLLENLNRSRKPVIVVLVILFTGIIAYAFKPYVGNYGTLFSYLSGKNTLEEVYIKNGVTPDTVFTMKKMLNAVENVNRHTEPGDLIYVWGYDPLIYYVSGRQCVSRFIYHIPLLWKGENTVLRNEFMRELENNNPKLIIVTQNDPLYYISGYHEDSKQLLERFPEFKRFIDQKYKFLKRQDDFDYYELSYW